MGSVFSSSTGPCSDIEYPGYSNDGRAACMSSRWIVLNADPPVDAVMSLQMQQSLDTTRKLLAKAHYPDNQVWWFLRWIYFDRVGTPKDAEARLKFLKTYLGSKHLQGFLSHEEMADMAKTARNKVIISLEETIPGNVNFTMITSKNEYYTSMKTIDADWLKNRKDLEQLARDQCQVKQCSLFSKRNERKSKNREPVNPM